MNSPLATKTIPHRNKYSSRGSRKIERIIVHHWAGTAGGDVHLSKPSVKVSANYILYTDGTLAVQVPEKYRAWTSGGVAADGNSVTVEIQNSTGAPSWKISEKAVKTLENLMADLSKRHGWGILKIGSNVRMHRDFQSTSCPGPYVVSKLPEIVKNANSLINNKNIPIKNKSEEEDDNMATAKEIVIELLNFPIQANGKTQPLAQLLADMAVQTQAQSNAVETEASRDKAMLEEISKMIEKLEKQS